jgi:hypothetical protein
MSAIRQIEAMALRFSASAVIVSVVEVRLSGIT